MACDPLWLALSAPEGLPPLGRMGTEPVSRRQTDDPDKLTDLRNDAVQAWRIAINMAAANLQRGSWTVRHDSIGSMLTRPPPSGS